MIQQAKLEDLIREKIPFGGADSRGFFSLKCQCCNDYKIRAGFKFENNSIIYNCWNCSLASVYEEFSGKISKRFRSILNDYGIDDTEISSVVNTAFFNKKQSENSKITLSSLTKVNTNTPTIKLPEKSFPLGHNEFIDYQTKLAEYLIKRKINIEKYPFFFSLEERFKNRIIIPFYRNGNLIYWQARSIDTLEKKRYDNAPAGRESVIFNFDKLRSYSKQPLFVTEGVFDAMMFDGVAILGSKLNDAKTELLSSASRRLVFVIDKDKNGKHLAEEVLKLGWEITFVPDGAGDLNESVRRFGFTWTANHLMKNIPKNADVSRLALELNCR